MSFFILTMSKIKKELTNPVAVMGMNPDAGHVT